MTYLEKFNANLLPFQNHFQNEKFKKKLDDYVKYFLTVYQGRPITNPRLVLLAEKNTSYGYVSEGSDVYNPFFRLGLRADEGKILSNLFQISISSYPHCCGMVQMNGFSYSDNIFSLDVDDVDLLMKACISAYRNTDFRCQRMMINMVETGRKGQFNRYDEVSEIPPIDNPVLQYPHFYTWAKKQKKCKDTLMMNGNSGNILHHLEVICN